MVTFPHIPNSLCEKPFSPSPYTPLAPYWPLLAKHESWTRSRFFKPAHLPLPTHRRVFPQTLSIICFSLKLGSSSIFTETFLRRRTSAPRKGKQCPYFIWVRRPPSTNQYLIEVTYAPRYLVKVWTPSTPTAQSHSCHMRSVLLAPHSHPQP